MPMRRFSAKAALIALGAVPGLCFAAWLAWNVDLAWMDRHFLPSPFWSRKVQTAIVIGVQLLAASLVAGILVLGRHCIRRRRRSGESRRILFDFGILALASVGAIGSAEAVLRSRTWHQTMATEMHREPHRRSDAYLGWTHLPNHSGADWLGGRSVEYHFDRFGYRVAAGAGDADIDAPSILFAGESIILGVGLDWRETIPAEVGARLGVQPVNLAVTGYSTDQAFLRLRAEAPRFACPLAIVTIFMPGFLDRNLNLDRPHLDRRLVWHGEELGWRVPAKIEQLIRYRSGATIADGMAMTSAVLRAVQAFARARGSDAIVILPVFVPETRQERAIRDDILERSDLHAVVVPLSGDWRIVRDGHPDARAATAVAEAIVRRLRLDGVGRHISVCNKRMN